MIQLYILLTILLSFVLGCRAESVEIVLQPGFKLTKNEQEAILKLSRTLCFDSVYQIEVGVFGKYDSSKAAVVKHVSFRNDTLQQEKWLYIWRREWTNSQLFRSFGDSSTSVSDFVTGVKSVRIVNNYLYRYEGRQKVFQFATSNGSYGDVKLILDCILSGSAVEDRMGFKKAAGDNWDFVKNNILEFKSVMYWGTYYAFEYEFSQLQHPRVGFDAKRNGDSCEIISFNWVGAGN